MDKKEAIHFLRESLSAIPKLAKLSHNNQEYPLWLNQVKDVIEHVWGRGSSEYKRLESAHQTSSVYGEEQEDYIEELQMRMTAILSIIKKYEILGIDKETDIKTGETSKTKVEQTVTVITPLQLFNAMQFHPRVIEKSKSLFESEHYAEAIFAAFKAVENFVRDKSGKSSYGRNLMSTVFDADNPIIEVPEAGHIDKDVQEGFKFLFMGAMQGIRNPKAHKEIVQNDPFITLEYLGFASFLLKRIDYWKADIS